MSDHPPAPPRGGLRLTFLTLVLLGSALTLAWVARGRHAESRPPSLEDNLSLAALSREASHEEVERTCAACHAYPPPEIFPKEAWPGEVERGFQFLNRSRIRVKAPTVASVNAYYRNRAPDELPVLEQTDSTSRFPVEFRSVGHRPAQFPLSPAVANVRFAHLSDERKLDLVVCDMWNGKVLRLKPYEPSAELEVLTESITNPAHAEVVDLNGDGIRDLIVANLGSPFPSEQLLGTVVWLKGRGDGSFTPLTLADDLGRVADVQPADFDDDGDLDLVVAVFGRLTIGEIVVLENRTTDDERPSFVRSTVDARHGAIHVPVADLNGDGRPDFVALISQEHETVVAFLNAGNNRFLPHVIYAAPHPAFGSTGIQLVDLDRDGDRDVLMTNGDTLDSNLLRPYHGIRWLENQGSYPFRDHHLASLYGVNRAVAADIDGDGDMDIAATTFLPGSFYQPLCREMNLDAVIILEQDAPGHFVRHSLETVTCDHATCDLGDFDADGDLDFVTGNFFIPDRGEATGHRSATDWVILRENLGSVR
jgi:hypothetical protein